MPSTRLPRSAQVLLAVLLLLPLAGCRKEPAQDDASIRKGLAERPNAEVLADADKAIYTPPADGKLTAGQVEWYVQVKRRAKRIREVARRDLRKSREGGLVEAVRSLGKAGNVATADLRAAQELGYNSKEYEWVNDRILEAEIAVVSRDLARRLEPGRRRHLAQLQQELSQATDPAQKAEIEQRIADFRSRIAQATPQMTPAVRHNARLYTRYRRAINAARDPQERLP